MQNSRTSIGLINPKSPDNVGSVLRAAGNFSVDEVLYTGERYDRAVALNGRPLNLARKVSENVSLQAVSDPVNHVAAGTRIVCVELVLGAVSLPEYQHYDRALYVFGPEDGNLEQSIIDQADDVVYVPTVECMNLAATVNVVLYDRIAKSMLDGGLKYKAGDDLIRQSRDTNNRLKIKSLK